MSHGRLALRSTQWQAAEDDVEICDFRTLANRLPEAIACYDRHCRPFYANRAYIELAGGLESDLLRAPWLSRSNARTWMNMLRSTLRRGTPRRHSFACHNASGETTCYEVRMLAQYSNCDAVDSVLVVVRDISEQKRAQELLLEGERYFRTLVENSPDSIVRYDSACRRCYINPALTSIAGVSKQEWLGHTPAERPGGPAMAAYQARLHEVMASGVGVDVELTWRDGNGDQVSHLIRLSPEKDASGCVTSVLAVGRDITHIARSRDQMYSLAFKDALTGLPNRAHFNRALQEALANATREGTILGLMLLDLDRFKDINDTLGHAMGDLLLSEAARRLQGALRAVDTIARLGGDEFAVLLPQVDNAADLTALATRLIAVFDAPFTLSGREVFVSTSVGISTFPADSGSETDLLQHADSAMYQAKSQGRGQFTFYSAELTARATERLELESLLRGALRRAEFELFYQPKVSLPNREIVGAEALLRWHSTKHGMVMPERFIGIAEDTGLIADIGAWVLRAACRMAWRINRQRKRALRIAVNVSTRQFRMNRVVDAVRAALAETGCPGEWLELEITESLLLEESAAVRMALHELAELGVHMTIDDFGTGHAALAYLKRVPVHGIKIDRLFISDIAVDLHSAALVSAIISLATTLDLDVVAEGVETPEQAQLICSFGCHHAQGYLYSLPLPQSDFEALATSFLHNQPLDLDGHIN